MAQHPGPARAGGPGSRCRRWRGPAPRRGIGTCSPPRAVEHLLDRGPRPAHPRPEGEHQTARAHLGEARRRGRRRDDRRRRWPGARRHHAPGRDSSTAPRRSPRSSARRPVGARLAEAHQVLILNDARVGVEVDGRCETGRDVVVGPARRRFVRRSAPLVTLGSSFMRISTSTPAGRRRHPDPHPAQEVHGEPGRVVRFIGFVAEDRELIAAPDRRGDRRRLQRLEMRRAVEH